MNTFSYEGRQNPTYENLENVLLYIFYIMNNNKQKIWINNFLIVWRHSIILKNTETDILIEIYGCSNVASGLLYSLVII